jgi:histidinol-phosphate aminotransferase
MDRSVPVRTVAGVTSVTATQMPRLREALDGIPAYIPGRPAELPGDIITYKCSSNENPYPPLPGVLDVIATAATRVNRYPDLAAAALTEAIAVRFGVPTSHVSTGTGSVGVCQQILQAVAGPGDEVLYAWRSFEAYPILTQIAGAVSVQVPLAADERHDLAGMAAAITPRTRLILICTPNNPTGTAVHRDELERFLDLVPADTLVVIDEAYREFVRDPAVPDGVETYRDRPNVAVLRTFSKAYGLAGLRVGFAIAHEPVTAALRKTALPFGVNGIAQDAAIASLGAEEALLERVEALVTERTRVWEALREQGWDVPASEANFVWLRLGEQTPAFAAATAAAGVMVRPYGLEGVRVTVCEPAANDAFLRSAAGWRAGF